MTEIPEEYLLNPDEMNPMQRSRMRRAQLSLAITKLLYSEYGDLSASEIQAVFVRELNSSIHSNVRPKRRPNSREDAIFPHEETNDG